MKYLALIPLLFATAADAVPVQEQTTPDWQFIRDTELQTCMLQSRTEPAFGIVAGTQRSVFYFRRETWDFKNQNKEFELLLTITYANFRQSVISLPVVTISNNELGSDPRIIPEEYLRDQYGAPAIKATIVFPGNERPWSINMYGLESISPAYDECVNGIRMDQRDGSPFMSDEEERSAIEEDKRLRGPKLGDYNALGPHGFGDAPGTDAMSKGIANRWKKTR